MNVHDESWLREQLRRSTNDLQQLLATGEESSDDLGAPQNAIGWLRLLLAITCLGAVLWLTGGRFLNYVVHHVWNQSRNSPMALIVPVLAVEFLWIIGHVHTGGLVARLKIGLGAAAICMTLFAPSARSLMNLASGAMDVRQLVALGLATWVFVDGWRDRRLNLQDNQAQDFVGQRP